MNNQEDTIGQSPVPEVIVEEFDNFRFTFSEAMEEIIKGNRVTRLEWNKEDHFCFLDEKTELLMIHRDGKDYQWLVSKGDMFGEDWVTI